MEITIPICAINILLLSKICVFVALTCLLAAIILCVLDCLGYLRIPAWLLVTLALLAGILEFGGTKLEQKAGREGQTVVCVIITPFSPL